MKPLLLFVLLSLAASGTLLALVLLHQVNVATVALAILAPILWLVTTVLFGLVAMFHTEQSMIERSQKRIREALYANDPRVQ